MHMLWNRSISFCMQRTMIQRKSRLRTRCRPVKNCMYLRLISPGFFVLLPSFQPLFVHFLTPLLTSEVIWPAIFVFESPLHHYLLRENVSINHEPFINTIQLTSSLLLMSPHQPVGTSAADGIRSRSRILLMNQRSNDGACWPGRLR